MIDPKHYDPPKGWNTKIPFRFQRNPIKISTTDLNIPSGDEIYEQISLQNELLDSALQKCEGTFLHKVCLELSKKVKLNTKYLVVDSKVQFFKKGHIPIDHDCWHLDGTIQINRKLSNLTFETADIGSRDILEKFPRFHSWISSNISSTEYMTKEFTVPVPRLLKNWRVFAEMLKSEHDISTDMYHKHSQGEIVSYDAFTLHRAVPAVEDGYRLWVRVAETNTLITRKFGKLPDDEYERVYSK